ncbi:RxLR effector protein [Phytophthora megakarya]|uniref:RxLR effector protein n=1 Tax=Phytophthora megakarya TaxID=4795 RepID=A0A225V3L4_9STRA|nr:RxLR effector protein [Phytophthora megakarya]
MRLAYILVVVIAASLHVVGTALPVTKVSNAAIEVPSSGIADVTKAHGECLLRHGTNENGPDEERFVK